MQKLGIHVSSMYMETISATDMKRQIQLDALVREIINDTRESRYLVIHSISRLSRNVQQGLSLIRKLRDAGIHLLSVTEQLDLDSPGGEHHVISLLNAAELESKMLSQRIKQGFQVYIFLCIY